MTKKYTWFDVIFRDGRRTMLNDISTTERALELINCHYRDEYDLKFSIVCVEVETERNAEGEFIRESNSHSVVKKVEFSEQENRFVFTK